MLRIDDFILYIPLKGNTNDYSLNGYTVTNNSVTLTTDEYGISGNAYEWSAVTDNLELPAGMGNSFATAANTTAATFYCRANFDALGANTTARLFSQYGNSGDRVWAFTLSTLNTLNDNCLVRRYSDDGTNTDGGESSIDSLTYTWQSIKVVVSDNGATNNDEVFFDSVSDDTASGVKVMKTNSTFNPQIGYQNNGGITSNSFTGKMKNIIVMDKELTSIEEKFLEKFGNMKRIA